MNWNPAGGRWSKLVDQTKRRLKKFQVGSLSVSSSAKINVENRFTDTDANQAGKAAIHLTNLHGLLNAIPSVSGSDPLGASTQTID